MNRFGRIAIGLAVVIAVEQGALQVMEAFIARNDAVIQDAIERHKRGERPTGYHSPLMQCYTYPIGVIYEFQLCFSEVVGVPGCGELQHRVDSVGPAGFITLIPRNYLDRLSFDRKLLLVVNEDGQICEEIRG